MSVETVRPAGAGHETLYVLLGSVLILALAATVVGLRQQSMKRKPWTPTRWTPGST